MEDIRYDADELDRRVVSKDQIRTVLTTFRDKLFRRHISQPQRSS